MTVPFGRRRAAITARRSAGPYTILETADTVIAVPGQFFMVAAASRWGGGESERPYLARALSTMGERATFLLDAVGPGTARLCELAEGDELELVGPLGVQFSPPEDARRAVLVAGGVGVPPLVFWRRALGAATVLCGFRDAAHAQAAALFGDEDVHVATDDGSAGHEGFVTDLLAAQLDADQHVTVYACGPPGMLEAVRAMCVARDVPAQLALESGMACGFGACYGCVVPLAGGGYARVCVDGPVIDARKLAEVPAH